MAFSLKKTLNTAGQTGAAVTHDDSDNIYFVDHDGSDYHVYQYNLTADSVTKISNNSSFSGDARPGDGEDSGANLVYFSGDLYLATYDSGGPPYYRVYKYDGTGTSWTLVDSITGAALGGNSRQTLSKTSSHIIFIASEGQTDGTQNYFGRYSSDGSSWSDITVDTSPAPHSGSYNNWLNHLMNSNTTSDIGVYLYDRSANAISSPTRIRTRVLLWDGAGSFNTQYWYKYDGADTGDTWVEDDVRLADRLAWYAVGVDEKYEQSGFTGTPSTPNNADVLSKHTSGFETGTDKIAAGYDIVGGDTLFYLMDPVGTWDSGETLVSGSSWTLRHVVRFSPSGRVFAFVQNGSNVNRLYERGETLDPAGTPDSDAHTILDFYFGTDDLVQKSTLQISNTGPRNLAVTTKDEAWIGSYTTSDEVVVEKGSEAGDFKDFEDVTGSIPTSYRTKTIRNI